MAAGACKGASACILAVVPIGSYRPRSRIGAATLKMGHPLPIGVMQRRNIKKAPDLSPGVAFSLVEVTEAKSIDYAALTSIFLVGFCASGFLGSVTVRTPFLKVASILSGSTPSGMLKLRSNEPKLRSCK